MTMQSGLLWHDSQRPIDLVIPLAAARYAERFGNTPNVCFVHPTALPDGEREVGGVRIASSSRVLKFHYWLGQDDDQGLA